MTLHPGNLAGPPDLHWQPPASIYVYQDGTWGLEPREGCAKFSLRARQKRRTIEVLPATICPWNTHRHRTAPASKRNTGTPTPWSPHGRPPMTAREIIERRLGRSIGSVAAMPRDLRRAMLALGLQLARLAREATNG